MFVLPTHSLNLDDIMFYFYLLLLFVSPSSMFATSAGEKNMNLSSLLNYDDVPSLAESDLLDTDDSIDTPQTLKEGQQGTGMGSMLAPVAVVGGIQAMRAVYNRLRGSEDDYDDDMPGVQEMQEASRWTQMNQTAGHGATQESVRGGGGFYVNSLA